MFGSLDGRNWIQQRIMEPVVVDLIEVHGHVDSFVWCFRQSAVVIPKRNQSGHGNEVISFFFIPRVQFLINVSNIFIEYTWCCTDISIIKQTYIFVYMCVNSILLHVPFQGAVLLHIRYFVPEDYQKLLGTAVWPLDGLISRNNLLHRACESSNSQQVVWQRWQRQTVHLQTRSKTPPLQVSLGNRL